MSIHATIDKNRHLLKKKNVVGIGVGEKWSNGSNSHQPALLVLVSKKEAVDKLSKDDLIPSKIDGHITDVVGKVGDLKTHSFNQRIRPVKAGFSCGHIHVTAGTLGGWFVDKDGEVIGLSNNHVLANENKAVKARQRGDRGHWTVQPGVYDNRRWRQNKIGNLKDFVRLRRHRNKQDSATFRPDRASLIDPEINLIGIPTGFNLDPTIGLDVQKSGRTTEHTTGKIIAMGAIIRVQYDMGVLTFEDQIITTGMSRGGDSGSLLMDMNQNVVGLLFAGSDSVTIHNPIRYPKDRYGLSIYNPTPISETANFSMTSNGVVIDSGEIPDLKSLLKLARQKARNGEDIQIAFNYSAAKD